MGDLIDNIESAIQEMQLSEEGGYEEYEKEESLNQKNKEQLERFGGGRY